MDRIAHALELARRGRRPVIGRNRAEPEKHIVYSRTRTVGVDRELFREQRIIAELDDKQIVDAYKLLRTRVLHRMQQNRWTALGITSPGPNSGKTLTAINLAISLALKHNYTVALVDADLRRPSIHKRLGIDVEYGLRDYLMGEVPVEQILIHPSIDRFVVLPGCGTLENPSELLGSPRMSLLVHELKSRYAGRLVLFDLPPVLVGDDVVAFSPQLDALMLVVEDGVSGAEEFAHTVDLLDGVNVIGTVLNKSTEKGHGGDYDYY